MYAIAITLIGCGGGGGGGAGGGNGSEGGNPEDDAAAEQRVELIDEGQVRSSGGLLRFRLEGLTAPEEPIEGLVDGSTAVQIAPVGDSGLALLLPELMDGNHSLSFRLGDSRRVFSIDTVSEPLPEDLQAAAMDYLDQLEVALNDIAANNADLFQSGDRDAYSQAIADAREEFATLDRDAQQRILRVILVNLAPRLESFDSSSQTRQVKRATFSNRLGFASQAPDCEVDIGLVFEAIAEMLFVVTVSSSSVGASAFSGPAAFFVLGAGVAIFVDAYGDLDEAFENYDFECLRNFVLSLRDSVFTNRVSRQAQFQRASQQAVLAGREFQDGADARLLFSAQGDYPDIIVTQVQRLQSAVQTIVDAVFPFLPQVIVNQVSRVTDLVFALPTEATFEPDMSEYQLAELSDDAIQGSVTGGIGFLDLRFTANSGGNIPENGLPFSAQLVDVPVIEREPLPLIDIDGRLVAEPERPALAYSNRYFFYRNGIQRGTLPVPESFSNLTIFSQPERAGTVMMDGERTFIFTAANDFVGNDMFEIRAESNGEPVRGEIGLTVFDNCRQRENGSNFIREENCVFDVEPGLRMERTRILREDDRSSPPARYLVLSETELTMVNYEGGSGRATASDRRVFHENVRELQSGGDSESIVVSRERRRNLLNEDGLRMLGMPAEVIRGSIAPGVSLQLRTETSSDGSALAFRRIICTEDTRSNAPPGALQRITRTQDESGTQQENTVRNDQGQSFAQFCGTRADVDAINDLVPIPF